MNGARIGMALGWLIAALLAIALAITGAVAIKYGGWLTIIGILLLLWAASIVVRMVMRIVQRNS